MEKNDRLPTPEGKCPDCDEQKDIWIPDSDGSFDNHDFKQHVDRQHKVGKWQCPYCDHKPFGSSSIRLNHMNNFHLCQWCECDAFSKKADLKAHIKKNHPEKVFQHHCPFCDNSQKTKSEVLLHIFKGHLGLKGDYKMMNKTTNIAGIFKGNDMKKQFAEKLSFEIDQQENMTNLIILARG